MAQRDKLRTKTMGMAASQARLLSITARIHDVEYQAQSIQNAKIQLSTQQDQVYSEYMDALDATTLTVAAINPLSGETSTVAATYNNLFGKDKVRSATGNEYILRDKNGRVVVESSLWNKYEDFKEAGYTDDPYMFAMFMLGADVDMDDFENCILAAEHAVYNNTTDEKLEDLRNQIIDLLGTDETGPVALVDTNNIYDDEEAMAEYTDLMREYRSYLYSNYATDALDNLNKIADEEALDIDNFDTDTFNYYVNIYQTIESCGGCRAIEDFDGPNGDAKNNAEWLQSMIQSGLMTIDVISTDAKGKVILNGTSPSTDPNLNYTKTTEIDKTAYAKAEAKYEKALKEIDKKDKKFDLDLSKLETQRTALTTEYESVKKVIEENIDRTFGIFS